MKNAFIFLWLSLVYTLCITVDYADVLSLSKLKLCLCLFMSICVTKLWQRKNTTQILKISDVKRCCTINY